MAHRPWDTQSASGLVFRTCAPRDPPLGSAAEHVSSPLVFSEANLDPGHWPTAQPVSTGLRRIKEQEGRAQSRHRRTWRGPVLLEDSRGHSDGSFRRELWRKRSCGPSAHPHTRLRIRRSWVIPEVPALLVSARGQTVKQCAQSLKGEASGISETPPHTFHPTGTLDQHRSHHVWPTEAAESAGTQAGLAHSFCLRPLQPKSSLLRNTQDPWP